MKFQPRRLELSGALTINLVQPPPEPSLAGVWVAARFDGFTVTAKGNHMAYTLPDDKQIPVQINYVDARGNPAQIQGNVAWASSDDNIVIVTPSGGVSQQTQAIIRPGAGSLGQAQVTATADADLGAGVANVITTFDVQTVAGQAVGGTITPVGDPQPITPDAPTVDPRSQRRS